MKPVSNGKCDKPAAAGRGPLPRLGQQLHIVSLDVCAEFARRWPPRPFEVSERNVENRPPKGIAMTQPVHISRRGNVDGWQIASSAVSRVTRSQAVLCCLRIKPVERKAFVEANNLVDENKDLS